MFQRGRHGLFDGGGGRLFAYLGGEPQQCLAKSRQLILSAINRVPGNAG
jgi:hypothetical protein